MQIQLLRGVVIEGLGPCRSQQVVNAPKNQALYLITTGKAIPAPQSETTPVKAGKKKKESSK